MLLGEWRLALRSLGAAETLMRSDYREDSVSRSYYAIFHAAKAVLFVHDIGPSSHAAVRRMFGFHLVRTGQVEPEWARELGGSLDDRLMADYSVHVRFSREETMQEYQRAEAFLNRMRRYLIENGISEGELEVELDGG